MTQKENIQTLIYTFKTTVIQSKSIQYWNKGSSRDLNIVNHVCLDIPNI